MNLEYECAKELAINIWKKYYKRTVPDWEPCEDLMGVLTQIDNMTCGLIHRSSSPCPICEMMLRPDHNFNFCSKCGRCLTSEHIDSENCWCEPILDYEDPETGNQVWVHSRIN